LKAKAISRDPDDKFNRVDMLAENDRGELVIIEVQNSRELDYFQRILHGVSKIITEYIHSGEDYDIMFGKFIPSILFIST